MSEDKKSKSNFLDITKNITSKISNETKNFANTTIKKSVEIGGIVSEATQVATKNTIEFTSEAVKTTSRTIKEATSKISEGIDDKNLEREINKINNKVLNDKKIREIIGDLNNTTVTKMFEHLGDSPVEVNDKSSAYIKKIFSIPKEQNILWVDAEFDLNPSGITLSDKGVFIRSNIEFLSKESPRLFFFEWASFDPLWFVSEDEENMALTVQKPHYSIFIDACKKISGFNEEEYANIEKLLNLEINKNEPSNNKSVLASAGVLSNQDSIFVSQKSAANTSSGHGEMVEEEITRLDKLFGKDAKVVGRDNKKNGADRIVDGMHVQTKYYNTSTGSVESAFDSNTKMYRYMENGKPMQLEVPKDQYDNVLERFKSKIEKGLVEGVSDPEMAKEIVREGKLTYKQAVNLTKAGNIDSLYYDFKSGAVISASSFGISFVSASFMTWRTSKDISKATSAGLLSGVHTSGLTMIQHILVQQAVRTQLVHSLLKPSELFVQKLGQKATQNIVNSLRNLAGKQSIYGAAASKHLAKLMRTGVITSGVSIIVFSVPDTYKLSAKKISGAQYTKNLAVLTASILGAVGGTVAAGAIAGSVLPGPGTAAGAVVGLVGGLAGGMISSTGIKSIGDILVEDDIVIFQRMFNTYLMLMITEYLLDEEEISIVLEKLSEIPNKEFGKFSENVIQSEQQENMIREWLTPIIDSVVLERAKFVTPSEEDVRQEIISLISQPA